MKENNTEVAEAYEVIKKQWLMIALVSKEAMHMLGIVI